MRARIVERRVQSQFKRGSDLFGRNHGVNEALRSGEPGIKLAFIFGAHPIHFRFQFFIRLAALRFELVELR